MGRFRRSKNEGRHVWRSLDDRLRMKPEDYEQERYGGNKDSFGRNELRRELMPRGLEMQTVQISRPQDLQKDIQIGAHAHRLAEKVCASKKNFSDRLGVLAEVIRYESQNYIHKNAKGERLATVDGKYIRITTHLKSEVFVKELYASILERSERGEKLGFRLGELIDFWLPRQRVHLNNFFRKNASKIKRLIDRERLTRSNPYADVVLRQCEEFLGSRGGGRRGVVRDRIFRDYADGGEVLQTPEEHMLAMEALQHFFDKLKPRLPKGNYPLLKEFTAMKRQMLAKPI